MGSTFVSLTDGTTSSKNVMNLYKYLNGNDSAGLLSHLFSEYRRWFLVMNFSEDCRDYAQMQPSQFAIDYKDLHITQITRKRGTWENPV